MLLFFICLTLGIAYGNHFPSGVHLCHRSDPNFNQCLGKNIGEGLAIFGKGSKYYGIPKLEPFFVENMLIKGEPTANVNLEQKYRNAYISGMTNSNVTDFRIDLKEKCGWVMVVYTPILVLEADYEMNGNVLMFPINGKGKCRIELYEMLNTHTMTCETYKVEDKTYLRFTDYHINITIGGIHYNFENLFPGNEQISAELLKTLNDNGLSVFNDIKSGFEQLFNEIHITMANKMFSKEPIDEIFLD